MSEFMHSLVHSLSMREKAYFKRFSRLHGDNSDKNYLKLYSFLEGQSHFDPEELKAAFADKTFARYMSSEMNHLLDILLKSLVNFRFEASSKNKLQKQQLYVSVLLEKGYRKKALKILRHAKKKAYLIEDFSVISKLIQLEEEAMFHEGASGFSEELYRLQEERELITTKTTNINTLRILREQVRDLQGSHGYILNPEAHPSILKHNILASPEQALSKKAKAHWYYVQVLRAYLTRQFSAAVDYSAEYLKFLQANSEIFKISEQLPVISNYLYNCALAGQISKFKVLMADFEAMADDEKIDQVYHSYIRHSRWAEALYRDHDIEQADMHFDELQDFAQSHMDELSHGQEEYLLRLILRSCVITARFQDALPWINSIYWNRADESSEERMRIYAWIVNYELERLEKLNAEIQTGKKVLKKKGKLSPLGLAFFDFFKKIINHPADGRQLQDLMVKLDRLAEDSSTSLALEHFDFRIWVKARMANGEWK